MWLYNAARNVRGARIGNSRAETQLQLLGDLIFWDRHDAGMLLMAGALVAACPRADPAWLEPLVPSEHFRRDFFRVTRKAQLLRHADASECSRRIFLDIGASSFEFEGLPSVMRWYAAA